MRVFLTGAAGFVGSHLARAFEDAEVIAPGHAELDLTDRAATLRAIDAAAPDAVVHAAILNDPVAMAADKARAWDAYVGATRNVVDAAPGAHVVLVSTDWVFDGTQGPAPETAPPNPVNQYGFLKAEDPAINMIATPTLASDAGALIRRALELGATGVLHCCGGEHADRVTLARRAAAAFGFDPALVRTAPPPPAPGPIPHDTRLDATRTAARLGVALPDLETQLARLRHELEEAACATT